MNYLTHRFSNLASLTMLLVLSVFTAGMFSFGMRANSSIVEIFDNVELAAEVSSAHAAVQASSTRK